MAIINLSILVDDISGALLSFDTIRVERSVTGVDGPWVELTKAPPPSSAVIVATLVGPYVVGGTTLSLIVDNGTQQDIVFSGSGSRTLLQVIADINAIVPSLASDDGTGKLKLTSATTGTSSKLNILFGSSLTAFGLSPGQEITGKEKYITLIIGHSDYAFADRDATGVSDLYRIRFYNTSNGLSSAYSPIFQGELSGLLTEDKLSTGSIIMVDAGGIAIAKQRISFYPSGSPLQVSGIQVAMTRTPTVIETDEGGFAQVKLARGLTVKVVVHGTSLIREVIIPDAPTFDLLSLMEAVPDQFDLSVKPNLPAAPRRTI